MRFSTLYFWHWANVYPACSSTTAGPPWSIRCSTRWRIMCGMSFLFLVSDFKNNFILSHLKGTNYNRGTEKRRDARCLSGALPWQVWRWPKRRLRPRPLRIPQSSKRICGIQTTFLFELFFNEAIWDNKYGILFVQQKMLNRQSSGIRYNPDHNYPLLIQLRKLLLT